MTGMLCWCCGEEPIRSVDFDDGERVVRFRHDCRVLAVAKQRVREARQLAGKNAERMATMELILREMYQSQAIVVDGETDAARDDRRAGMRRGFEKIGPLIEQLDAEHEFEGTTFSAVLDANTCPACREDDGQEGKPVPHPGCTNPNGCRCRVLP